MTVEQALSQAKKATKQGNTAVAMKLYRAILKHQPDHLFAKNQLRKLQKESIQNKSLAADTSNTPQEQITALVKREMGAAYPLRAPLDVSAGLGLTWHEAAH